MLVCVLLLVYYSIKHIDEWPCWCPAQHYYQCSSIYRWQIGSSTYHIRPGH